MLSRSLKSAAAALLLFGVGAGSSTAQTRIGTAAEADQDYQSGRFLHAETVLTALLKDHPDDADLLRRMAAVEAARGHLPDANLTIDRALQLSPMDRDIQLARANILLWRGQMAAAKAQADALSSEDAQYPGLDQFHRDYAAKRRDDRPRLVTASLTLSDADVTFPSGRTRMTWRDEDASLSYAPSPATTITGEEEVDARARTDVRMAAQIDHRFSEGNLFIGAAGTPHAYFRERWSIFGGGEVPIGARWDFLGDVRYAQYRTSTIGVVEPGLRLRPVGGLSITGQMINLFGGGKSYRLGGLLRVEYAVAHTATVYSTVASYPDTESDGTRQVRSLSVGTAVPLYRHWALRLSGAYEKRDNSYLERQVTLGVQWHFTQ